MQMNKRKVQFKRNSVCVLCGHDINQMTYEEVLVVCESALN